LPSQRADDLFDRLPRALRATAAHWRGRATSAGAALRPALIASRRDRSTGQLQQASQALDRAARSFIARDAGLLATRSARLRPLLLTTLAARDRARLGEAGRLLGSLGPQQVLARGYALVIGSDGSPVTSAARAAAQSRLTIRFADGETPVTPGAPVQGRLL
jgi:exodeoxyribonuclease VII large subunit